MFSVDSYFDRRRLALADDLEQGKIAVWPDEVPRRIVAGPDPRLVSNLIVDEDFSGEDLRSQDSLNGKVLKQCDFRSSCLDGLQINGATLSESNFRYARGLKVGAVEAILKHVDACWSVWSKSQFRGGDLQNSRFVGSTLTGCNFSNCNLSNVTFMGALIQHGDFRGADLSRANLRYADLTQAMFDDKTKFDHTDLSYATLASTTLPEFLYTRGNFEGVKALEHAHISKVPLPWRRRPEKWLFDRLQKYAGLTRIAKLIY